MTPLERGAMAIIVNKLFFEVKPGQAMSSKIFKARWRDGGNVDWVFQVRHLAWDKIDLKEMKVQVEVLNERGDLHTGNAYIESRHWGGNKIRVYQVDEKQQMLKGSDDHGLFEVKVKSNDEVEFDCYNSEGKRLTGRVYRVSPY